MLPAMDEVRIRDVPEHVVVTERRSVDQAELERWLPGAMARVAKLADDNGGVAGTTAWPYLERADRADEPVFFVVYEGNPNEGPTDVEVAAPLHAAGAVPAGAVRKPAHREAFVRLRKEQTGPLVGAAFAKVERWLGEQGLRNAGPPREVYYTDYHDAADTDDVFDVAFPVA